MKVVFDFIICFALLGLLASSASLNVTMASLSFVGNISQDVNRIEKKSLEKVAEVVEKAAREGSDVLALPEGFFWWYLPTKEVALEYASPFVAVVDGRVVDTDQYLNPCDDTDDVSSPLIVFLSCLAKERSVYIASNMATKSCCGQEAECKLWNTEVVFSPKGDIVATYRKSHVYGSTPPFDAPDQQDQDVAWFTAEEGLKIGLLVCFDLEFFEPAEKLISDVGVDAVLMSMYWVNTPPISWSTLYQQAWSLRHEGVTLIAVNDGNNAQTWGNGAYHNGWLVSNQEAFLASEGDGAYPALTWVVLPVQRKYLEEEGEEEEEEEEEEKEKETRLYGGGAGKTEDSPSFPCSVPFYGQGVCADVTALTNNNGTVSVSLRHRNAQCTARVVSPLLKREGGDRAVAAALDVEIRDPGAEEPLHLLICSVFVCSSPSSTSEGQVESCDAMYGSFSSSGVDLALTISRDSPQSVYQVLPLAAGADLHTLKPSEITFIVRHTDEGGEWTALSVVPQEGSLSSVSLFLVDQGSG